MSGLLKLKAVSSLRSDVWDHFEKGEKTAKCKHCDRELSFCGGTTNLRDHLLQNHTKEYQAKKDSDESKRKIDKFVLKTTCSSARARKITQLLVDMVAMDARPTATVEGTGFKRLLNYLEPGYKVPSAVHITSCLHERYSQVKGVVMEYLQSASYIALTSDVWTSLATQSYISATTHFVTSEWELNSCVLQTLHFPESHTGVHVSEKLKEICSNFSVSYDKVVAVVHDHGSNMQASLRILHDDSGWASVNCAAHTLQLCVNEGLQLPNIAALLGTGQKLVGHFKHSSKATAALAQKQKQMNIPVKKLIQDCPTRWNSSFYMLKRILEVRWPISAVLDKESITKKADRALDLRSEQWTLTEDLLPCLQKIEIATVYFSEEEKISLSTVLPIVFGLADDLQPLPDDSIAVQSFKRTVKAAIMKRWNVEEISSILLISTALDPRFKLIKHLDEQTKAEVTQLVISNTERLVGDIDCTMADSDCTMVDDTQCTSVESSSQSFTQEQPPVIKKAKKSALDILLGPEEDTRGRTIKDEVEAYLHEKVCARKTNVLEWWKLNEARFPNIAKLAKAVICIPATSTPSERLFSTAGHIVSKRRTCLNPENVDVILFLNKNLKFLK